MNSNVTIYVYNSTMHAMSEYGVATNTKVTQFSIQCSLFASVTNELSKGSPVTGMGGSSNFVYNSPTQGLGSVTVLTNNPFLAGTYGSNYLNQSSTLINGGYISSDYWLLYHFTTATNHAKESNTVVDVGFHYPSPADTDADGLYDFVEDASGNGTYASNSVDVADLNADDTDGDGLNDYDEYMVHGTNPKSNDSDGDGFDDAHELSVGSDPLSATSYPVRISGPITYAGSQTGSLHIAIWSFEPVPYPTAFYMPFTTNEGSQIHDRSGRGNTGTVQGATWSSAGFKGGAYSFDGNDRILVGDLAVVEGQTNVTFGAWIKRSGGSSLNGILGKTVSGNESMYLMLNSSGAGGVAYVVPQSKALESYAEKSPIVTNHLWMHLAGVYSGTNMKLYANGQCVATGATHALEAVRSNTVTAAIGDVASDRGWYFTGLIDEVTVYQQALSDALVKAMAQDAQAGLVNRHAASNGIPAAYSTPEVPSGSNYWVVAWIDTNGNGDREYWEPYGAYTSNPVMASGPVSGAAITLLDPDADGDGASDGLELSLGTDPFNKDSYPATIAGTVFYTGGQTGPVRVVAVGTNYVPFAAVLAAPGAYTISNVPNQRTYTVSAYRDSNTNGIADYAEAQGSYSNNPITLLAATTNLSISLTEADTDGDGMPDWWEIQHGLNPTSGVHASQVAWWRFEETAGLTASNALNASHHGSMTNMSATNRVGGKLGQGMWFDGVDDRIEVSASLSTVITNRITVDAWVKAETLDEASLYRGILAEKYVGDQNVQFAVHLYGSNHNVRAGFFNGGWRLATDSNSFTTSVWRRVSATFNGTNIVIYMDGIQVATGTAIYNLPIGTNGWRIGQRHDGGGASDMWHGLIDELRVYSSALSSNQIATMYDAFNDPDGDGLDNLGEYVAGSDPSDGDTDGDGLSDGMEASLGTDPLVWNKTVSVCDGPDFELRTISATRTKTGYESYIPQTPPLIFTKQIVEYAGDSIYEAVSGDNRLHIASYGFTVDQYDRRGQQFERVTCLGAHNYNSLYKAHGTGECDLVYSSTLTWTSCIQDAVGEIHVTRNDCSTSNSSYTTSIPNLGFPAAYTTESLSRLSYKWTETTNDAAGTNAPNQIYTFNEDWSSTLSHEYSSSMLFDDVSLDLLECGLLLQVPWGSDVTMGVGCANTTNAVGNLASKTLSTDERTAHVTKGHYRARLSNTEAGVVYRMAWLDRFVSVTGDTNDIEVVDVIVGNGSVVYTDYREASCPTYGTRNVVEKELVATIQDIGITGGTVNSHELDDGDGNTLTRQYIVPMTTGGSVSVACTLNPGWANQFVPDCFSFTGGLATSNQLVRLVSTDFPGEVDLYAAIGTNWASVKVHVLKVELDLAKTTLTLMETNKLTAVVTPSNEVTVSQYTFEIKRDGSSTWYQLYQGSQPSFDAISRVAGNFDLRVSATVGGVTCVSQEKDVEAQFPSGSDILAGQGVQSRMDQAWTDTKNATTPTSRREEGYYITLDTSSGAYGITAHTIGTPVANNQGAGWDTATYPRPPDSIANPTPLDQPTYTIGWFHTHTPTTYRSVERGVSPSDEDYGWSADGSINIPGYAYDYTESPSGSGSIPAAHPINSAAQIYTITPPTRRSTP